MNKKLVGVGIALLGIVLACYEGSVLAYEHSFTETAEGVIVARSGNDLTVRFHTAALSSAPKNVQQTGYADCAFPQDAGTANLKVGDIIRAYYPPGKFADIRLDRNFNALIPLAAAALGGILALAGIAIAWFSSPRGGWS